MSNKWCDSIVKHESTETGVLSSSSKLLIVLFFILLILIFSFVTYPIQILLFADTGKTVTTHMNCTVLSNEIPKITAKDKEGVTRTFDYTFLDRSCFNLSVSDDIVILKTTYYKKSDPDKELCTVYSYDTKQIDLREVKEEVKD